MSFEMFIMKRVVWYIKIRKMQRKIGPLSNVGHDPTPSQPSPNSARLRHGSYRLRQASNSPAQIH